jgi:ribose transport system ATP-binding protein
MTHSARAAKSGEIMVSLDHAWKFYGSFAALRDASIALRRGEVHMLLGENGAGKSTLVSLLIGTNRLDRGTLTIEGRTIPEHSPTLARALGINAVLQDFSLAPALTVAENYFLGREIVRSRLLRRAEMRALAQKAIATLGVPIDVDTPVSQLSRAEQQVLEIARAIGGRPGALILDEPTATLSHEESNRLFEIVSRLRAENWAILYITHRMEEVRRLGDVVTVLRDGQRTGFYRLADVSNERLVQDMVGRPLTALYPKLEAREGPVALEVSHLATVNGRLRDVSLQVRFGEIVGVGGLVGCGKAELARVIFGIDPAASGQVLRKGRVLAGWTPRQMLDEGLVYLPQDRRGEALALNRSIAENVTVEVLRESRFTWLGLLRRRPLRALVADIIQRLDIRPPLPEKAVQQLSGGNQQKVVLGRALSRPREVYIFDEPTAGVDIGARQDFYRQLERLCAEQAAVLLITSDIQELIHVSHRIYVMHAGKVVAELSAAEVTEDLIVACSFGEVRGHARQHDSVP